MIDDKDTLAIVGGMLAGCANAKDGDDLAENRVDALNYYFMRPRGDEQDGRSQVVSGDVSAMVEAVLSQMLEAFTDSNIAAFDPESDEDAARAALESEAVTDCIMKRNRGYLELQTAIKCAELARYAVVKVWPEESTRRRTRVLYDVSPEAFAELEQKTNVTAEFVDLERGTVRVREQRSKKTVRIGAVMPENFVFTRNWPSPYLDGIPCCGERHVTTRAQMVDDWGFDQEKVETLTKYDGNNSTELARNPYGASLAQPAATHASADLVEWFELYCVMDYGGELTRVCFAPEQVILSEEAVDERPYAAGVILINPGTFPGVSIFDKVAGTQDKNTAFERMAIDNGGAANRPRTIYSEGMVSQADLEDGRVNGNIGVDARVPDVRMAVAAHVVPDMTAGTLALIELTKRNRAELGGAALELAGGQAQLTDRVGSQGLDRAYSVMEQLASMMTRTFAESLVRDLVLLVHRTMRNHCDDVYVFKHAGKTLATVPSEWGDRELVTIKLGMSPNERRRQADALWQLVLTELELAKLGLSNELVSLPRLYRTIMDWCRVVSLSSGESYFIDPESTEAKQAAAQRTQTQQAEKQAQQRLMNMALGLEQMRVSLDKRNADADRVLEYFKAILDAEKAEAAVVGDAATKFELQRREAEAAAKQSELDADTAATVAGAAGELATLEKDEPAGDE